MFKDYYSARMHFQNKKTKLNRSQLNEIIDALTKMGDAEIFPDVKDQIADLILDIEHYIDCLDNFKIYISNRKKEHRPDDNIINEMINKYEAKIKDESATVKAELGINIEITKNTRGLIRQVQAELIKGVLSYTSANLLETSRLLGITGKTLYNILYREGIDFEKYRKCGQN